MKVRHNIKFLLALGSLAVALAYAGISNAAQTYSPFAPVSTEKKATAAEAKASAQAAGYASVLSLEETVPTEETHSFSGSETQMEELDKLEPIVNHLKLAVDAHNVMNRLGGYRNIQKQYNQMVQLHDKSVEILGKSEQCTLDYLGRYFNNPVRVWSGTDLRKMPANHDLRQGLSKWAIEMFELAKSAQVSPIDAGDLANVDGATAESFAQISAASGKETMTEEDTLIDTNVGNPDTAEIKDINDTHAAADKQIKEMDEKQGGNYFKEPSKQDQLEQEARKTDLLTNDIGAEVALWMADYLASASVQSGRGGTSSPAWVGSGDLGGVKQRFPVWNDQRTFYAQYLDRKYKNIKQFIKDYEIPSDIRQRIADAVMDSQRSFVTQADADIVEAAVRAINIATADRDAEVAARRSQHASDTAAVNNKESSEIKSLSDGKNTIVNSAKGKINSANAKRDEYGTLISDLVGDKQRLEAEINSLNQEVAQMDSLLSGADLTDEQKEDYNKSKSEAQKQVAEAKSQIAAQEQTKSNYEKLLQEQTEIINAAEQQINDVENQYTLDVNNVQAAAQSERTELDTALAKEIDKLNKELAAKIERIKIAEAAAKATLGSKSVLTAEKIIAMTNLVVATAKDDAYTNIDKAHEAMSSLGDDLYRGNKQPTVTGFHQALYDSLVGKEGNFGGLHLDAVAAKVHDVTNFLTDIVTDIDAQMSEMYINDYRSKVENSKKLLNIPIFDKVLSEIKPETDTQYFVGATAKLEDFRAPKTMPDFNLPPLREYVRLDYIDLQSIAKDAPKMYVGKYRVFEESILGQILKNKIWEKTDSIPVSVVDKEKFLSYGGRIPEIWKLMLQDKAFVDSDFYLTQDMAPDDYTVPANVLKLGSEMSPLYRGGIYPCILRDIGGSNTCNGNGVEGGVGIVDVAQVSKNDSEYVMALGFVTGARRNELADADLPVCQEIKADCHKTFGKLNGKLSMVTKPYLTLLDKDDEGSNVSDGFLSSGSYSELGSIFGVYSGKMVSDGKMVNNILAFNPEMQSVVNYGIRMEERSKQEDAPALTTAEQKNDDIYVRAQYNVNQVGDFLAHVEVEQGYRESLEELQESMTKMKDELYDTLRTFGFEPSPEFDISKEADYDLAWSKLKAIKQSNMGTAKDSIDSIEPGDSDLLFQSKNNYSRIYNGLATDREAVTTMTMDVDNLTEFAEDVKTGTVNNQVSDKYEENADESFEDQMKAFKPAYCAVY